MIRQELHPCIAIYTREYRRLLYPLFKQGRLDFFSMHAWLLTADVYSSTAPVFTRSVRSSPL